jgi:hypothetical protein
MMIPESLLEQALALVFDGKAAGERLSFYDMTQQWNRLGLRLADLRDAVRETVDRHFLRVQDQQGMLVFELTAAGSGCSGCARRRATTRPGIPWANPGIAAQLNLDPVAAMRGKNGRLRAPIRTAHLHYEA